jgi:hypothetical protein
MKDASQNYKVYCNKVIKNWVGYNKKRASIKNALHIINVL